MLTKRIVFSGAVFKKYPTQKSTRKGIRFATIQEKEDQITSKEVNRILWWLIGDNSPGNGCI